MPWPDSLIPEDIDIDQVQSLRATPGGPFFSGANTSGRGPANQWAHEIPSPSLGLAASGPPLCFRGYTVEIPYSFLELKYIQTRTRPRNNSSLLLNIVGMAAPSAGNGFMYLRELATNNSLRLAICLTSQNFNPRSINGPENDYYIQRGLTDVTSAAPVAGLGGAGVAPPVLGVGHSFIPGGADKPLLTPPPHARLMPTNNLNAQFLINIIYEILYPQMISDYPHSEHETYPPRPHVAPLSAIFQTIKKAVTVSRPQAISSLPAPMPRGGVIEYDDTRPLEPNFIGPLQEDEHLLLVPDVPLPPRSVVVFHCAWGWGRTGTMVASLLLIHFFFRGIKTFKKIFMNYLIRVKTEDTYKIPVKIDANPLGYLTTPLVAYVIRKQRFDVLHTSNIHCIIVETEEQIKFLENLEQLLILNIHLF